MLLVGIPVITHTASDEMVLYALDTRIAISLNVRLSWTRFLPVFNAVDHTGAAYLTVDDDTLASNLLLLLLIAELLGMIRDSAEITAVAFLQT